ncbi:MAG: class IV adenylate cyclase [Desulfovibrio sp.]|jgi:adenylate cyclase class 2|nr:class IV adenylate cyclase [Desulfovibrio sp.]
MTLEIERKYLNVDFNALRPVLESRGGRCLGAHFERNALFDTCDAGLFASKRLLRLREWVGERRYLLTLKLPRDSREDFKVCDEREVEVADGESVSAILEGLGYAIVARYEKIREIWRLDGVDICLDVLPFMTAVELEGEPVGISRVADLLGLSKATASVKNYHDLHQQWRRQHNMPPEPSFVFSEEQRCFWRKELSLGREV